MIRSFFTALALLITITSTALAADWWVRPAGGDYGLENGSSYENAWDGIHNIDWAGINPGDTLWVSGIHIHEMTTGEGFASQGATFVKSGTGENTRITIRGDASSVNANYPDGIVWGAFLENYGPGWTETAGHTGVWEYTLQIGQYEDWFFEVNNFNTNQFTVLEKKASIDEVEDQAGSFYATGFSAGDTLYVSTTDFGNPTGRILFNGKGYQFRIASNSYITFRNLIFNNFQQFWFTNQTPTHIRIQNSTFLYGCSIMFPIYDGMDYFEILDNEIAWAGNAIYTISSTDNGASYYNFSRNNIHDIGVREVQQNGDAHSIGIQGGHDGVIEGNTVENCGTGPFLYAFPRQELKDVTVARNYVRNVHLLGGANSTGVGTQSASSAYGEKTGNKFYYNIVVDAKICYRFQFEDEQLVFNNIGVNCDEGLSSSRTTEYMEFDGASATIAAKDALESGTNSAFARVAAVRQSGATGSFTYGHLHQLNFTSGGPAELLEGDNFIGDSSGILNTARFIRLTSGSWAGGDAAGMIAFNKESGNFVDNETFSVDGGQANIFTMDGNRYQNEFVVGEALLRDGGQVATLQVVGHLGPHVKARNNIFLNSGTYHVKFATGGEEKSHLDINHNRYYPDGPEMFMIKNSAGKTDFAGMQATSLWGYVLDPNSMVNDPLFENESNNYTASTDFKLTRNSTVIDAGEAQTVTGGDFVGNPIIHLTDIGAREFPYSTVAPTADAGPDQTVNEGDVLTLDGSGSSDTIDGIAEWRWAPINPAHQEILEAVFGGSSVLGETVSAVVPNIILGRADDLIVVVQLTVTDNGGLTDTDTITITIRDTPDAPPAVPPGTPTTAGSGGGGATPSVTTTNPSCFILSVL